ncbi:M56 family metallopeptidase [Kordia sp.]|uniref:M56 family metallopeptidase n=1 Tax=Kordia sp. TaxID=1965332 RepID=UPI0025BF84B4|nr:M56 family metallopeptidase [Kordia sp.]MCH2192902.1 M56 family metallopeptidase [Kordia sp.]
MIVYFIQVVAFQLLFLLSYDLFLKKETFFNWNRVYLIFSSLVSFLLPFIKIESFQNVVPQEYIILLPEIVLTPQKAVAAIEPTWNWFLIIGISISSLLFIYKIIQLVKLRFKGRFVKRENYTIIIIPKSTVAFSIFKYVFIGDDIHEEKLEDILSHELVHIREKHSLDLMYFELLRILCWFNPLVYIYQKRISEVHEYIADATIVKGKDKSDYYEKLLAEVFQTQQFSFTNQFFKHSLIKKRIIMLTKQKSREILKLKYLVLVPVLIVSLLYTSCEDTTIEDADNTEQKSELMSDLDMLEAAKEKLRELNRFSVSNKILTKAEFEERNLIYDELAEILNKSDGKLTTTVERPTYEEYLEKSRNKIKKMQQNMEITEIENEAVEFRILDKVPVFPGCESYGTLEELKKCFVQNIQKHIAENFDVNRAHNTNLSGTQRIFAQFLIDKNGDVVNLKVRAPHPDLQAAAEEAINTLPKLTPGMKDGKPVSVKYILPIVFKIAE